MNINYQATSREASRVISTAIIKLCLEICGILLKRIWSRTRASGGKPAPGEALFSGE
mgnify:CR=1 FL=1